MFDGLQDIFNKKAQDASTLKEDLLEAISAMEETNKSFSEVDFNSSSLQKPSLASEPKENAPSNKNTNLVRRKLHDITSVNFNLGELNE